MPADPFATADIRAAVLDAWAASPARFREDANAEEDLARGGYRDRLVVELAQNAADAARRARVPGRLLLRLEGDTLVAANTGGPLDAAGVSALSTLRASAKRADDGDVGRFGVGFAAVLAVTDEPVVGGVGGAVRFSRADTFAAARAVPSLAEEVAARSGHVPVLRLPWPAAIAVPDSYDTSVVLPLRDPEARALAQRLLAEVGPALLLVLPTLTEVLVETGGVRRVLTCERDGAGAMTTHVDGAAQRWRRVDASGSLDPALLSDRPSEERLRPTWSVTAAAAVDGDEVVAPPPGLLPVVHAPTPTDEPWGLPVLLVASFPLDPTRRHVAAGALAGHVAARAADAVVELVRVLAREGVAVAPLVPRLMAAGAVDATVRRAVLAALRDVPLLPAAEDARQLLRPADAVVLDGASQSLAAALAPVLGGLAAPGWPRGALDALDVSRTSLADVVDELAALHREPSWWRALYAALDGADAEALAGLPVPLADGRTVRGPRGLLLPADGLAQGAPEVGRAAAGTRSDGSRADGSRSDGTRSDGTSADGLRADGLRALGLRVVHPAAVHPLLERLGARPATPAAVLADPAVAAAVAAAGESADAGDVSEAVLSLVAAAAMEMTELPWLGGLLLRDEYGELARADGLVVPGSAAAQVLDDLPRLDEAVLERWGAETVGRVGVLSTLGVLRLQDVTLDPDELDEHDVDGLADWADDVLDTLPGGDLPPLLPELAVVRDLDYVGEDAWPQALRMLAGPPLRSAVVDPVRVVLPDGSARDAPSPTARWLRGGAVLDGRRAGELRLAGADDRLEQLYRPVELDVDETFLRSIGVRTTLEALLAERGGADDLLDRMLDVDLSASRVRELHAALAQAHPEILERHDRLRVPGGSGSTVAAAEDVVVASGPWELALPWPVPPLLAPAGRAGALALVLDVARAADRRAARVERPGIPAEVPAAVRQILPAAPSTWMAHDVLVVDGTEVDWWLQAGVVHAATMEGLAKGLAWVGGRWPARWLLAAVLAEPERLADLLADAAFDPPSDR